MASASGAGTVQERKAAVVEEIRSKLAESDAAVLTEYRGLKVAQLAELRGQLRPAGTEYKVFKNTLARRAAEEAGLSELASMLEGPVAIAFVRGDAVLAAKALRDFARTNPSLIVKGGLLGPRLLGPADIDALAEVAPREVLLARLAGGFQAPLVKAAGLFQAFTRNMAYGIQALIDQRTAAEPPAEDAAPAAEVTEDAAPAAEVTEDAAPAAAAAEDTAATDSTETETSDAAESGESA